MKISEPPYTNRGVTRQKEDLTALIDWCQITVKGVDVFIIIEDILRIPLSFMELHGKEKGIAGHELIARFDNIKILKPTGNAQYQGFQILMSGKGCRNYENFLQLNEETWFDFLNRVCQYHINVPRIDLAIDDRKPYLSIPDLIVRTKEGLLSTKLREIDFHDSGELKEEVFQSKGGSLYLGSSASNLRLVFYEKGYEQAEKFGKELNPDWNRYELRFRHKKAGSAPQITRRLPMLAPSIPASFGTRRFLSWNESQRAKHGGRVQKVSVDAGFTCPNRDGSKGTGGCTYCNNQTFSPEYCKPSKTISQQVEEGIAFFHHKYAAQYYLAYFQSYTNTYDKIENLKAIYEEALSYPNVRGLVIGTRPDCVSDELLDYFAELAKSYYVMIEYGIESTCDKTLEFINRGHDFACAERAIRETARRGIKTGEIGRAHV